MNFFFGQILVNTIKENKMQKKQILIQKYVVRT